MNSISQTGDKVGRMLKEGSFSEWEPEDNSDLRGDDLTAFFKDFLRKYVQKEGLPLLPSMTDKLANALLDWIWIEEEWRIVDKDGHEH